MLSLVRNEERRRAGRMRCDVAVQSIGEVVDLSGTGMRVRRGGLRTYRPGTCFHARLLHGEGELPIKCRVVRVRRLGFMRCELGIEFVDQSDEAIAKLRQIALASMSHRNNTLMTGT